jgi:succinate dehydrogenase/fumarate reductase cytochrome b subunit
MDYLAMFTRISTLKIATISIFCALSIGTNYALVSVVNVKPMDFIVFLGGFLFGEVVGSSIGIFSWLIYGSMNPYGFDPRIWVATMLAESLYGITGGLLRRMLGSTSFSTRRLSLSVFFAAMGFLATVLYDLTTNTVYASVMGQPLIIAILTGAVWAVVHEGANFLIFGVLSVPTIVALKKVVNG